MRLAAIIFLCLATLSQAQVPDNMVQWRLMAASRQVTVSGGTVDVGSPYAYWPMTATGTNTTRILDFASTNNLLNSPNVATGPTLTSTNGYFYTMDGVNDSFIDTATNSVFSARQGTNDAPFAVSVWVYRTGYEDMILGKDNGTAGNREWYAYINADATVSFGICSQGVIGNRIGKVTTTGIPVSRWQNLIFEYDGSKTEAGINIWTNGVAAPVATFSAGSYVIATNGPARFVVGGRDGTALLAGAIDEVVFFTNTLTSVQKTNRYNKGRTSGDSLPTPP